jgi:LysM repeat protein
MNPDLLSANVSFAFMAIIAAALLAHLSQLAGPRRLSHGVYAATAAGLLYLFGARALGWSFVPREALLALYAALFVFVAAMAFMRRNKGGIEDVRWTGLLIEQAAMAYLFVPGNFWKPPLAALLLLYFVLELFGWLKGSEEAVADPAGKEGRPALFPPKRVRGVKEFALAGAAAALVYVFAMGTGKAPVAPAPEEQQTAAESAPGAETSAPAEGQTPEAAPPAAEQAQAPEASPPPAAPAAETPAPVVDTYTAAAGDTLKSLARKLYGKADKWRALAAANPGVKPTAKLKAGQVIKLPEPPAKR